MSKCFNAAGSTRTGDDEGMVSARPHLESEAGRGFRISREIPIGETAVANSLQDALRGAGLVKPGKDERKRRGKRRGPRAPRARPDTSATRPREEPARPAGTVPAGMAPVLSSAQARSLRARSQAIARDPWLSGARRAQALREREERALVERARSRRLDDPGATRPFHFTRGRRVKRIFVTEEQARGLLDGEIMIVGLQGEHLLLPREVAEEIASQRPDTFVHRVRSGEEADDGEDPGHAVPDDLVW